MEHPTAMAQVSRAALPLIKLMNEALQSAHQQAHELTIALSTADKEAEANGNLSGISTQAAFGKRRENAAIWSAERSVPSYPAEALREWLNRDFMDWETAHAMRRAADTAATLAKNPGDKTYLEEVSENLRTQMYWRAQELGKDETFKSYDKLLFALKRAEEGPWGQAAQMENKLPGRITEFLQHINQGADLAETMKRFRFAGVNVDADKIERHLRNVEIEASRYLWGNFYGQPKWKQRLIEFSNTTAGELLLGPPVALIVLAFTLALAVLALVFIWPWYAPYKVAKWLWKRFRTAVM